MRSKFFEWSKLFMTKTQSIYWLKSKYNYWKKHSGNFIFFSFNSLAFFGVKIKMKKVPHEETRKQDERNIATNNL